jgi:rod shape-determining protein MreD
MLQWGVIHTDVSRDTSRILSVAEIGRRNPGALAISYLSPLLAIIVGIVHAALAPVIVVAGIKPNLVLVAVVLVTCLAGFQAGIVWAFVAGLTANLLVGEPLGTVPLAMLIVAALTAGGARALGRLSWVYPIGAAFAGSIAADALTLAIGQLVGGVAVGTVPGGLILGAAALNAVIAAILLFPARSVAARWIADESPAW